MPVTLLPSPFPRHLYYEALALQPIINELSCKVANDLQFLQTTFQDVIKADEFTKNLLDINLKVNRDGLAQPVKFCINRSDYMLDRTDSRYPFRMRQVEVNAISCSMAAHSLNVSKLHEYIFKKYNIELRNSCEMPKNGGLELVADSLIEAFNIYNKPNSYVLFVVEDIAINFSDYYQIEINILKKRADIKSLRVPFSKLQDTINLGPNKELFVDGKEIAVVYLRHAYDPHHYEFSGSWETSLTVEQSRAIKCPSVNYHLAGAKKIQQVLNNARQLERFLTTKQANQLSEVYCKIWSLDSEDGYRLAKERSDGMVLKPQREGGGNNIYLDAIPKFVENLENDPVQRSQYILMEYIKNPSEKNWIFRNELCENDFSCDKIVSELGIYGSILDQRSSILEDKSSGYLVRSKRLGVNEGGVASGYAAISSLLLLDDLGNDESLYYQT